MNKNLAKTLKTLTDSPGIYKMIDEEGRVIYIGKAKNLKKRVKQYFQKNYQHSTRTKKLLEKIHQIETIAVDTELEAIILEHNLIKQLSPKYNVIMKDDKSYVYIKITREDFPRIQIVRNIKKDKAKYIGPKTAAHKVKATLKVIKKLFPFRHCGLDIDFLEEAENGKDHKVKVTRKVIKYPCLDYFIKRCAAPCIGKCSKNEYAEIIKNVEDFLDGKPAGILAKLQKDMTQAAKSQKFEKAAKIRDKMQKIKDILEKQKISSTSQEKQDIINYCIHHERAYFNLFQIRDGKMTGQENFILKAPEANQEERQEILEAFIKQYYEIATDIPSEILIPHELESQKQIGLFIQEKSTKKCKIIIPQRGKKNKLLEMSLNNARIFADRSKPSWQEESHLTKEATEQLQKILKLEQALKRIECYDISHLSGTDTVGSMVVFENGAPKKDMYRKFKLRTVQGKPDDFKSMEEVLYRRFHKIIQDINLQDYKFRKAKKVDKKTLEKQIKEDKPQKELNYKEFFVLEHKNKVIAAAKIQEISEKISQIEEIYIHKEHQEKKLEQKIIKNLIIKAKGKRIYAEVKNDSKQHYAVIGFEEVKKAPKELKKRQTKTTFMVFDKIKHKPDKSFSKIPDLVIIDGGKGQLSAANKIFTDLKLQIPHIALAKRLEEIFIPGNKTSIILEKNNKALQLLQRARDEAHRFAISYNKKLRSKKYKP